MVVSRDETRQMTVIKPVTELFRNKDKEIWSVTLVSDDGQSETLGATAEHPFYVEGRGWVNAAELQPGDQVVSHASGEGQGGFLLVKSVELEDARQDTYNFEVADTHTYFVGKLKAWVHNTCSPKDLIANGGKRLDDKTIIGSKGNKFELQADGTYKNTGPATNAEKSAALPTYSTDRAASNQVKREVGVPTSQQPVKQGTTARGDEWYIYDTPASGGGTKPVAVIKSKGDPKAPGHDYTHYEAGTVKLDDYGNPQFSSHGEPKIYNDGKVKAVVN